LLLGGWKLGCEDVEKLRSESHAQSLSSRHCAWPAFAVLLMGVDELRVWQVAREYNMRLDEKPGLHAGGPRESREMRHTGSHLSRTGSRL
jgi:hypothetical protein